MFLCVCVCVQKHAFGQEGYGVERPLHVLAGDSVQRSAAAAAGAREPPERPHLLLLTPAHGPAGCSECLLGFH